MPTMADLRRYLFPKEEARREKGHCPFCNKHIILDQGEFRDALSAKEFTLSGLCQECQDQTFGKCEVNCGH